MSATSKKSNCYHCGGVIANETIDLVLKKIPLSTKKGKRMYTRKFHMKCVSEFVDNLEVEKETQEENTEWEMCYEYFKDLLEIPEGKKLDSHAVLRILGTRVGKYIPQGNNVRGISRGYDFETILMAMKFSSMAIKQAFGTMQFKDQKHKIDYAMKIVTNNINFVDSKLESKRRADGKFEAEREDMKPTDVAEYKKKSGADDKVSSLINNASLNDDIDSIMELFE